MGNASETMFLTGQSGERRGADRRDQDRRAPRRPIDPLFAATLVNQVARPERAIQSPLYQPPRGPRPGIAFNLSA